MWKIDRQTCHIQPNSSAAKLFHGKNHSQLSNRIPTFLWLPPKAHPFAMNIFYIRGTERRTAKQVLVAGTERVTHLHAEILFVEPSQVRPCLFSRKIASHFSQQKKFWWVECFYYLQSFAIFKQQQTMRTKKTSNTSYRPPRKSWNIFLVPGNGRLWNIDLGPSPKKRIISFMAS